MFYESILFFIFGTIFGSFATCFGHRIFSNPDSELESLKSLFNRSKCDFCNKILLPIDMIPVISYFFIFKRKCRFCKHKISIIYPITELLLGLFFALIVVKFELSCFSFLFCIIMMILLTQSVSDLKTMMASDLISIMILIVSIVIAKFNGDNNVIILIRIIVSGLFFIILPFLLSLYLKKDCFGFGDVKIIAGLSCVFTFYQMILFFGLCGLFGVISHILNQYFALIKTREFPFLPSIMFAFFISLYFSKEISLILL